MVTAFREITPPARSKHPLPIILLAVFCCLVGAWTVFTTGLIGADMQYFPLVLSGVLLGFIAVFEIRVGLAALLLAIGLSPELEILGIPNFRYEDIIFPILFVVWLTKHSLSRRAFSETNLKIPILIILFLSLLTTLNNKIYGDLDVQASILRFGKSVVYYFIFVIVLNSLRSLRDLQAFAYMMIVSSAFVGVYGLSQYNLMPDHRVTGPPGESANILGGYYVFHMCLATGLLTRAKSGPRFFLLCYLALMAMPFVQTLSRTSYVALIVGVGTIWVLGRNRSLWGMVVLIALVVLLSPPAASDRFLSIFGVIEGDAPSSWVARVAGWKLLLAYTFQAPLLGMGVGTVPLGAADNEYMLQLNELGILGLFAFLWLIIRCLKTSYRLQKRSDDPTSCGFCLGYFGGSLALLTHSIGATTFTTIRTTEPFFFATGLLYVYYNYLRKKDRERTAQPHEEMQLIGRAHNYYDGPLIGRASPSGAAPAP